MADGESDDTPETILVPGAHRTVRVLDHAEGPFPGTLVTSGDGVAVLMDAAVLDGWVGWRYSGAEHVAAPIDVSRRTGGQDVLLPWCADRVLGFLVRRSAAGAVLAPGECSTLVISLLRGLDEVGEGIEGTCSGVWWLTDDGRPVFVLGDGPDIRAGVAEIIGRLAADTPDKVVKRALGVVEQGLGKAAARPRLPRALLDTWERELLNVAAPQPLERGTPAPERARTAARTAERPTPLVPGSALRLRADRARENRGIAARFAILGDLARVILEATRHRVAEIRGAIRRPAAERPGEDASAPGRRRRRSVIVAGAAAALVLAAGLLWPDGGEPGEAAAVGRARATTDAPPPPEEVDAPADESVSEEDPDDPVSAARALLATIGDCRAQGDLTCAKAVAAGSVGVVEALGGAEPGVPVVELVDEYGDVAVVRLVGSADGRRDEGTGADGPANLMVVLIRAEDEWLVRDVYDVADQPG